MVIVNGWRLKYKKRKPRKSRDPQFREYHQRNARLSELGYVSYAEYLASADWAVIRGDVLRRFSNCFACARPACQVHHLDYSDEVLLGLIPRLLVALCRDCHEAIEFEDKRKRTLPEANRALEELLVANGRANRRQVIWKGFRELARAIANRPPPRQWGRKKRKKKKKDKQPGSVAVLMARGVQGGRVLTADEKRRAAEFERESKMAVAAERVMEDYLNPYGTT